MRLHAIVEDLETARAAVEGGATVVQLRIKGASTDELVEAGHGFGDLPVTFVVNDDVEAALRLGADGVHLGREDEGAERALAGGLLVGLSASSVLEAREGAIRGAAYLGAGPVWATPSKRDADPPIGLGGVDAANAGDCIRAGASGVAVIRAARDARALRAAIDVAV